MSQIYKLSTKMLPLNNQLVLTKPQKKEINRSYQQVLNHAKVIHFIRMNSMLIIATFMSLQSIPQIKVSAAAGKFNIQSPSIQ